MILNLKKKTCFLALILLTVLSFAAVFTFNASADSKEPHNGASIDGSTTDAESSYVPKMSITLNSNLEVNVYVPFENTVSFTFDGVLYDGLEKYEKTAVINGASYYKVTTSLPAAEAARDVILSVNAVFDEKERSGSFIFSIPKYAEAILSSNVSDVIKTLIKDTLAYISSSYSYFGSEDAETVTARLSEILGNYKGTRTINAKDADETPGLSGASFVLDSKPAIKFYIPENADKSEYTFYANNRKIDTVTEGVDDEGRYLMISLYAYRMCGAIDYSIRGEHMGSYRIHNYYSFVSKGAYVDENKEALRDLLRKFYNYSLSSADYFIQYHSEEDTPSSIDLGEFAIVYPTGADSSVIAKATKLADVIEEKYGITLAVVSDNKTAPADKIIFVGGSLTVTNVSAVKLAKNDSEDAFIIDFTKNSVAIFGKTESSSARAVEYFIESYLTDGCGGIIPLTDESYTVKPFIALENGSEIVVETTSTVFQVKSGVYTDGLYPSRLSKSYYPSVIELRHNGENNGKLIAILAVNDTPSSGYTHLDTNSCVMESSDGGKTWKMIARPQETIKPTHTAEDGTVYNVQGISMAHIYELPTQVGDMPEGTLLYSGTSVHYDCYSQVAIWRSFDCGYTWEEFTVIDTGGGSREGVWEPFTWYEKSDGYLYCFYSDDSDPLHDQKLVFKRSKDGVNWSDEVAVCEFSKKSDRPGMIIMTQMGSGEYLMVYEYYGIGKGKVYYKITDDITSWNPKSPGELLTDGDGYTVKGGPACIWTSVGGEKGILLASGKVDMDGGQQHLLYVSFDYGRSWTTIENPLPYDITLDSKETNRIGHSPTFIVGSDPSVIYYLNTTVNPENGYQMVEFAKLRIYE